MERKPPRHSDGPSSRPANRGPGRPRGEGDSRPPRRDGEQRNHDRGDRFESRGGPRGGREEGGRSDGGWNDRRDSRDFGDRPSRPARAEWQGGGDRPRSDRPRTERSGGGDRFDRPRGDRPGGERPGGDRPRFDRNEPGDRFERPRTDRPRGDRPGGERPGGDRPRFDRNGPGDRFDRPRTDRPRGDRPGGDRPGGDRPRFDRDDRSRFSDRRPRHEDSRPALDDDAGNRMDYEPRQAPRFDDRRPRRATFVDRDGGSPGRFGRSDGGRFADDGGRGRGPGRGDRPPRERGDRDNRQADTEKPRKERYQVWNKELPPVDASKSDRATLKMGNKGDVIERKIYGVNACLSFFAQRPQDVIRAYFTEAVARQHFGELMKFLAQEKLAYHLVPGEDMERITESTHHEGVCLLVRDQPAESFFHWMETNPTAAEQAQCILALEDLGNPHNVGAILRVAAHFGVKAVVVKDASLARSGAAMRTAEGGAEHVKLLEAEDFERMLAACRREGYTVVATSSHKGANLFEQPLPARAVILLGQESKGLSANLQEGSDLQVCIPGTRQVESLNVSVAAGILLAEYWRSNGV